MINRTAVIGHGPSLVGRGTGEHIDLHKYVLRFPCMGNWQSPEDYGTKTSYMCSTLRRSKRGLGTNVPELGFFFWTPWKRGIGNKLRHKIKRHGGGDASELIQFWELRLSNPSYPRFSHGTAAILIAMSVLANPITVFGCDSLKTGNGDIKKYVGSWVHEPRRPNKKIHDFKQERELIEAMSEEYNIPVVFV